MKQQFLYSIYLSICFLFLSSLVQAQSGGIEGFVSNENNERLAFATIYIRNIESGTTSNSEGYYQIKLSPGKYDIIFQYLGIKIRVVDIFSLKPFDK